MSSTNMSERLTLPFDERTLPYCTNFSNDIDWPRYSLLSYCQSVFALLGLHYLPLLSATIVWSSP